MRYLESTNRAGVELPRQRLTLDGDGWLAVEEPNTTDNRQAEARRMRAEGVPIRTIAEELGISRWKASQWTK